MSSTTDRTIDIVMLCWNRSQMTLNSINYLVERTRAPYRLFVIDNSSDDNTQKVLEHYASIGKVFFYVTTSRNVGVHMGWNIALSLVESDLFITTDNDIYVPSAGGDWDAHSCWLDRMVELMDDPRNNRYAAIAAQPHVFLGDSLGHASNGVINKPHCGAVMRIMRTEAVRDAGGWERHFDAKRNHEEKTICSRLASKGWSVGYAEDVVCYHDFGDDDNWGYGDIHPHDHGHRIPGGGRFATDSEKKGEIWPPPSHLQTIRELNNNTWRMKNE